MKFDSLHKDHVSTTFLLQGEFDIEMKVKPNRTGAVSYLGLFQLHIHLLK